MPEQRPKNLEGAQDCRGAYRRNCVRESEDAPQKQPRYSRELMTRVDPETLQDAVIIYLASSLSAARAVEDLLTTRGVNYAVEVQSLGRTTLFGSIRHGAAFYVANAQAADVRAVLRETNLARGVVEDEGGGR